MDKRDYSDDNKSIHDHYRKLRTYQTLEYSRRMRDKYCSVRSFDLSLNVWDALEKLDKFIDISDPDLVAVSNIYHAFQTAEGMRSTGELEWFQLIGLIHDLGKVIYLKGSDEDGTSITKQWGVGGDTFIVGCAMPDSLVLSKYNKLNPDYPKYGKLGIYESNCGFDLCEFSFGHDEYLYQVLLHHKNQIKANMVLPDEALYIIRYHSFYPWHDQGSYNHLASDYDKKMLVLLKRFNKYDLYTKSYDIVNMKDIENLKSMKEYYTKLINKY